MNRVVAVGILFGSLAVQPVAPADDSKRGVARKELDKFLGTGELIADGDNGLTVLESSLKNDVTTLAFQGDRFTITWPEGHSRTKKPGKDLSYVKEEQSGGTLQLDATREPKEIDFVFTRGPLDGKTWRGNYRWDDGKLVVCLGGNFGKDRPTEFKVVTAAAKGDGTATRIFKKRRGPADQKAGEPTYEFSPHKDTRIVVAKDKDRTVFVVTSPSGIGQAGVELKAGQWPANITLRFRYSKEKGGGFTNLEHIRMTTDRLYTEGSLGSSGQFPFGFLDGKGHKPFEVLGDRWAAGKLKVVVERRGGTLDVSLPPHVLTGSARLDV
jgi:uncharacterized protein (TIGR03067 family)